MIYATWSQGFRHGGANGFPTIGPYAVDESLLEYAPDEADNFEVGIKGTSSDQSLRYSLSVYRIDWENPQLDVFLGPLAIPSVINGSEARNQGIESELTAQLTDNLTMTFGYSYTSAELTKAFTIPGSSPKIGNDGDPLPGVPKRQASLALNYYQPIENGQANYYLNGSYRSEVDTTFNSDFSDYANLDGFSIWNLGVNWELDGYSVGLFVNNATNEEGMTGVSGIERPVFSQRAALTRPRSYGVSFSYNFE
jgi:outer membrane receptor protein involved in Fe transport